MALNSCQNDEGYSLDNFWVSLATVKNTTGSSTFLLQLDNGTLLWPAANQAVGFQPADSERVMINYTILSDKVNANYDHDIRLNDITKVLTKPVIDLTTANKDSIGNDPLTISSMWLGDNYLNVVFSFMGNSKTHMINLVRNTTVSYTDGKVHLELRQNAYNDLQTTSYDGIACFKLKPLLPNGATSVDIVVDVKNYDGTTNSYSFKYELIQALKTTSTRNVSSVIKDLNARIF
jgi:hypothetical protein